MYEAFDHEREVAAADIKAAFHVTVPLSVTRRESIDELRAWARTRARPAS